jgi:hypothetical protein
MSDDLERPSQVSEADWFALQQLGADLRSDGKNSGPLTSVMRAASREQRTGEKLKERNGRALRAEAEAVALRTQVAALREALEAITRQADGYSGSAAAWAIGISAHAALAATPGTEGP